MADDGDEQAAAHIRDVLDRTAAELAAVGAREQALAEYVVPRRLLGLQRPASMRPLGRVWRLGVLLLARDGVLRATGKTTRAVEPGHGGHTAVSVEQRREYRAAAYRGPFERGTTVNFDAPVIDLGAERMRASTGPLFVRDGRALVRWNASLDDSAAADFDRYVAERVDLLLHPPEGA